MDSQQVLTIAGGGLLTLLIVCGPIVLVVLSVGLVVSIFQAATQIHEATLSFVPKLLAAFATLGLAGPWMLSTMVDYIRGVLLSIPSVVGWVVSFTEAQVLAWITPWLWAFFRVAGIFTTAPVLSQKSIPRRVRLSLAILIVICAQPNLPPMPDIAINSPQAVMVIIQQVLIGLTMGFAARVVFAAIEFAGEIIGLQMGLSFASFFDPMMGGQANGASRFLGTTALWLFIVMNGHLLLTGAVLQSFHAFPVSPEPLAFLNQVQPQVWGAEIFKLGLWISLPVVSMLLLVNMVLGLIARVAPQMNVFSIGFPVTLSVGFTGLWLTLPMMEVPLSMALERMMGYFQ